MTTRTSRTSESREEELARTSRTRESRENNQLQQYHMGFVSPLDLPPGIARDGFDYYWAAKDIRGEIVYEIEELSAKGWTLVPGDRCSAYNPDPLKRNSYSSQYYCRKELILMERESVLGYPEKAKFYKDLNDRTNSIQQGGTIVKNDVPHIRANSYNSINSF
jgi:hypothetical protein